MARGGLAQITKVSIEQSEGHFKPDVTLESNAKKLLVEIAVTHKVDRVKLRHIRKKNLPTIEIQLGLADAMLSRNELRDKLEKDIDSKRWLYHPEQKKEELIFVNKVRAAFRNSRRPAIKMSQNMSTRRYIPKSNTAGSEGLSNAQMDRMRYEFFLRFKRQPTEEEGERLQFILYGSSAAESSKEQSYALFKSGQ